MIDKLIEKIKKTGAPIVVGLDPKLDYVPGHIQKKAFEEYGETLEGAAEAIWQYNKGIVDNISVIYHSGGYHMTEEAKEARRAYQREWRKKNPEKVKAHQARHWEKIAALKKQEEKDNGENH